MDKDREAEINKKIELLKQKNEKLMQRHQEIENDKKLAEKSGRSVNVHQQRGTRKKDRYEGRHGRSYGTPHMDEDPEPKSYPRQRPRDDGLHHNVSRNDGLNHQVPRNVGYGRSRQNRGGYSRGRQQRNSETHDSRFHEHGGSDELSRSNDRVPKKETSGNREHGLTKMQQYEQKRRANIEMMNQEMEQGNQIPSHSKFLDDPRREPPQQQCDRPRPQHHRGNYGGGGDHYRGKRDSGYRRSHRQRGRGTRGGRDVQSRLQMSAEMTGRERIDYERWNEMKEAADKERMKRSKDGQGNWRRQWDIEKQKTCPDDINHQRTKGIVHEKQQTSFNNSDGGEKEDDVELTYMPEEKPLPDVGETVNTQVKRAQAVETQEKSLQGGTPSSKDGTEIWAQNSHNSDDSKPDWKNGINKSSKKWVDEEGASKQIIDERKLEQESGGATVYSRKLGRGWGEEKNIEATKAWVQETANAIPPSANTKEAGDGDVRDDGKIKDSVEGRVKDTIRSRLNERSKYHSSSPILKRKNDLTVKISPRVYHNSESNAVDRDSDLPILKTPEGVKNVTDWATEVELQSPTANKAVDIEEICDQTKEDGKENIVGDPTRHIVSKDNSDLSDEDFSDAKEKITPELPENIPPEDEV